MNYTEEQGNNPVYSATDGLGAEATGSAVPDGVEDVNVGFFELILGPMDQDPTANTRRRLVEINPGDVELRAGSAAGAQDEPCEKVDVWPDMFGEPHIEVRRNVFPFGSFLDGHSAISLFHNSDLGRRILRLSRGM